MSSAVHQTRFLLRIAGFFVASQSLTTSGFNFLDTGIRTALINNFNPLQLHNDIGELQESHLVLEWLKRQEYQGESANSSLWRTYHKQELELVEEREASCLVMR